MLKIASIVFALVVAAIFCIIATFDWSTKAAFRGNQFKQAEWMDFQKCERDTALSCDAQLQRCPRGSMVQDLRSRYFLNNVTTKSEISKLIGERDKAMEIRGLICETYFLGYCSPMSFDGDSLYICYDESHTLIRSGHITH